MEVVENLTRLKKRKVPKRNKKFGQGINLKNNNSRKKKKKRERRYLPEEESLEGLEGLGPRG